MTRNALVLCFVACLTTLTDVEAQVGNRPATVLLVNAGEYVGTWSLTRCAGG
jgi:hypothetical protein